MRDGLPDTDAEWAREYEHRYLYACFLYYNGVITSEGPLIIESPLDDAYFDSMQTVLERWYDKTSKSFQARTNRGCLKTEAHALQFTDYEMRAAVAWAGRRAEDPLNMAMAWVESP